MVFHISVIVGRCTLLSPTFCTSFFLPPFSCSPLAYPLLLLSILICLSKFSIFSLLLYFDLNNIWIVALFSLLLCALIVYFPLHSIGWHIRLSVCVCRLFVFIFYLLINSNGQRDKQKNNSVIAVKSGHRADHHERKSRCVNEWMNGQEKTHEHNSLSGDARDFGENWWEPCGRMEWHANIHEIKYIWISEINSFGWIIIVFNRTGAPQIHFTHSRSI